VSVAQDSAANQRPRLCLIRHGQASLGTADYDRLSERGQRQARLLGERVAIDYPGRWQAWSGSLRRHRQTLAGLAPDREGRIETGLNEYTVDQLIRAAVEQADRLALNVPEPAAFADPKAYLATFLAWFPDVLSAWQQARLHCEHNGRWVDFHQRVLSPVPFWRQAIGHGESAVVVTSAGVISTIVAELTGEDLAWQRELNIALYNASVTELSLAADGRWQLERLNCIDHLPGDALRTLA
jgi:broad specificity phosphatase PhoE